MRSIRGARGRLAGNAPNSDTRLRMVSPMGGNVRDDNVISTGMEAGSSDIGYGKDM